MYMVVVEEVARTIFISAAEASADVHAAKLIHQLRAERGKVHCEGLGGEAMAAAGCELLENLVDRSAMLTHAIGQIFFTGSCWGG